MRGLAVLASVPFVGGPIAAALIRSGLPIIEEGYVFDVIDVDPIEKVVTFGPPRRGSTDGDDIVMPHDTPSLDTLDLDRPVSLGIRHDFYDV